MIYCKGIRKIFDPYNGMQDKVWLVCELREAQEEADKAGYRLLTFNGQIWAKTLNGDWILTVLNIDDFEAC